MEPQTSASLMYRPCMSGGRLRNMSLSLISWSFCSSANFQERTRRWKRQFCGTTARYINSKPPASNAGSAVQVISDKAAAPASVIQLYWIWNASLKKLGSFPDVVGPGASGRFPPLRPIRRSPSHYRRRRERGADCPGRNAAIHETGLSPSTPDREDGQKAPARLPQWSRDANS